MRLPQVRLVPVKTTPVFRPGTETVEENLEQTSVENSVQRLP
jgi:hypothetical protein